MIDIKDLTSRVDLISLVQETHELQKQSNRHVMPCPFHHENKPSFVVYEHNYHCYGCKTRGDAIDWLCKTRGLGFKEAIEFLGGRTGMVVEDKSVKSSVKSNEQNLRKWCSALKKNQKALDYLKKRGIYDEIDTYRIGYAEDGQFAGHIVFPITSVTGRVLGFTSRNLKDSGPKSLNSKNSKTFQKSEVLYGIEQAWKHAQEQDQMILVEGAIDAIRVYSEGHKNVVAILGGVLGIRQLATIVRHCGSVCLFMDNDVAGRASANVIARQAYNAGLSVTLAVPDTDPAESDINANLEASGEFLECRVKEYDQEQVLEDKIQKEKELVNILNRIDCSRREFWRKKLSGLKIKEFVPVKEDPIISYIRLVPDVWQYLDKIEPTDERVKEALQKFRYGEMKPGDCSVSIENPEEEIEQLKQHLQRRKQ